MRINKEKQRKRVLLLNAGHNDERILRALKELNCYVITTGNRPELPGHKLADEYIYGDYTNLDEMYQLAKKMQVDAVCPCCNDFGVMTAAYVSEKLGFKGQDDYKTTSILHNKDEFKAFAAQLGGIRTPFATSFTELEKALIWAEITEHNFPLIVKPADLSAGNGIHRADSVQELQACICTAFEKSRVKHIVIESFIEGSQHGFCTYLLNRRVVAVCSNNEHSFINPYRVEVDTYPANHVELVQDDLIRQIERIAQALELSDGIFHLQYILKDDQAHILECMRRVLGNLYSIPAEGLGGGFGWDYWEVRAKCGFGCEGFPVNVPQRGFWAYRALIAEQNGVYDRILIPADIQKYIYLDWMLQKPGYEINSHISDPIGFLFMCFPTQVEMLETMIDRYSEIKILVK